MMDRKPTCAAQMVVGGKKRNARRGHTYNKWHCFECALSDWFKADDDVRKSCVERKQQDGTPLSQRRAG